MRGGAAPLAKDRRVCWIANASVFQANRRRGMDLLSDEDKGALVRLVAMQALEDLQDVRDAYRAIEQLLDVVPPEAADLSTLAPLLRNLGNRFDGELRRAHEAARKLDEAKLFRRCTCAAP